MASYKEKYAKRKSEGLCVNCGKPNDNLPKVMCTDCNNKYNKIYHKGVRERRINEGKCPRCGKNKNEYNYYCTDCREVMNEQNKVYRAKLKAEGKCYGCLQPLLPQRLGKCYCTTCEKKHQDNILKTYHLNQSIGICPRCRQNSLINGEKSCLECRAESANRQSLNRNSLNDEELASIRKRDADYHREMRARRKASGICVKCGKKESVPGKTMCLMCADKHNRYQREKSTLKPKSNRQIWRESGLCYFCGSDVEKGYKVCTSCHERLIKQNNSGVHKQAREKIKKYWN